MPNWPAPDVVTLPPHLFDFRPTLANYVSVLQGTTTFQTAVVVPDFTAATIGVSA